jgi:hypothetical protein
MKLLSSLVLVAACVGVAHADTPASYDGAKFIAWFDKLTDQVVADQNDCPKMAADINKAIDDNKAMMDDVQKAITAGRKPSDEQEKHLQASAQRLVAAQHVKCGQDKAVAAAFERFPHRKQ